MYTPNKHIHNSAHLYNAHSEDARTCHLHSPSSCFGHLVSACPLPLPPPTHLSPAKKRVPVFSSKGYLLTGGFFIWLKIAFFWPPPAHLLLFRYDSFRADFPSHIASHFKDKVSRFSFSLLSPQFALTHPPCCCSSLRLYSHTHAHARTHTHTHTINLSCARLPVH